MRLPSRSLLRHRRRRCDRLRLLILTIASISSISIRISVPSVPLAAAAAPPADVSAANADTRALISQADLLYEKPVPRSEDGMPLGNGRMGSLVWTSPTALKLQINRVDVFGSNCATNSFPERNTDYCGSCALVDLE